MSTEENKARDEESETQEMAGAVSNHAPKSMFDPLPLPQLPAPPGLQYSDAWAGGYVNLAFRGNVEALQKRVLPGWHVSDDWKGPGNFGTQLGLLMHGANMVIVFHDTYQWSELHPPSNADPHPRFVAVLARARNPKTNAVEFMHLRTYTSDPARVPGTYGDSMLAKITRNISVQGNDGETEVREGYDIHTSDGGSIHFAADYKRPMPLWTYTTPVDPNTTVINSTVGPPLRRVYWEDAQTCVMVSQGLNVNVPRKLEVNVNLVDLADVTQGAHLVAMLIRPCYTRRVFVTAGLTNGGGGE